MRVALRVYRLMVAFGGMTLLGIATAILARASFGRLVPFNRRVFVPAACRLLLLLCGIRVKVVLQGPAAGPAACYFFNHNSYLDLFLVPMLGLPRTRAIISEGVKGILPLHLCSVGIDVLYIPDSHKTAERIAFFQRVSADLRANHYSVICSPEGQHEFLGEIAKFNRGVFHMAMAAQAPIELVYFDIPAALDPLESSEMSSGTVTLRSLGRVDTAEWTVPGLPDHIADVRKVFVDELARVDRDGRC